MKYPRCKGRAEAANRPPRYARLRGIHPKAGRATALRKPHRFSRGSSQSQVTYGGLALGWSRNSNADLWAVAEGYLDMLRGNGVEVSYEKASGHSGEKWNDAADRAAVAARKGDRLLEDAGYAAKMRGLLPESARMSPDTWFAALEPVSEALSKKARKAAAAEAPITEAQVVRFLAEGAKDGTGSAYRLIAAMVARGELSLVHLAAALQARMR